MGLAWNICAPLGTLSTFFFNPVFQVSTAKNEINLFNNHILIEAPVTFAPAGAMTPSAEFLLYQNIPYLNSGVVGWCEGAVYLTSLGRPTDIGLQLGKACYPCSG